MSEDCEPGQLQDRSLLRAKEVRLQEALSVTRVILEQGHNVRFSFSITVLSSSCSLKASYVHLQNKDGGDLRRTCNCVSCCVCVLCVCRVVLCAIRLRTEKQGWGGSSIHKGIHPLPLPFFCLLLHASYLPPSSFFSCSCWAFIEARISWIWGSARSTPGRDPSTSLRNCGSVTSPPTGAGAAAGAGAVAVVVSGLAAAAAGFSASAAGACE